MSINIKEDIVKNVFLKQGGIFLEQKVYRDLVLFQKAIGVEPKHVQQ